MLLESDVINAVCKKLEFQDYFIQQKLQPNQQGDDIIAVKAGLHPRKLIIEAKGETSSRIGSERYGKPFDSAQVRVHVAEAFYKSAQVLSRGTYEGEKILSGIALPDTNLHRNYVKYIQPVLDNLQIIVFWVDETKNVQITSPIP